MNNRPLSGEIVEIKARLSTDLVENMDVVIKTVGKKSRRQFIEEILEDWYRHDGGHLAKGRVE